jgi:hypothetical protein
MEAKSSAASSQTQVCSGRDDGLLILGVGLLVDGGHV